MELYQLYYFLEIAKDKNFTRAAERLHVSQSSLSKAIQRLEAYLGVKLFDRQGKQVGLTQEGEYFHEHIRNELANLDAIVKETKYLASTRQETVHINIPPNIGADLLALLMRTYIPNIANSSVEIIDVGCMAAWDMLLDETIELGWTMGIYIPKNVEFQEVEVQEFFLVTSADHPLAKRKTAPTFQDLSDEIFLIMSTAPHMSTTRMLEEHCIQAGYRPIRGLKNLSVSPNPQVIQGWVEQGLGISFVPQPMVRATSRLQVRSMNPPLTCPVGLAWKKKRQLSISANLLRDFIIKEYKMAGSKDYRI